MFANSGSKMNNLPSLVATWIAEAVAKHGFNWKLISAYLDRKIESLPSEERNRLSHEAMITTSVRPESDHEIN